ncbi:MAG: hypothetical protein HRU41_20130 [Saprospiraceae bacterium]|nr:hypothetical protein [Saprospiraceae bacterium]
MQLTKPKKKHNLSRHFVGKPLTKNQIFLTDGQSSWRAFPTYPFDELDFRSEAFGSLVRPRLQAPFYARISHIDKGGNAKAEGRISRHSFPTSDFRFPTDQVGSAKAGGGISPHGFPNSDFVFPTCNI